MARPRLFWRFASDYGALTASSETYGMEAGKLLTHHLAEVWRTGTTLTTEWIKADLGQAVTCGAVALLNHDLDGTETGLVLQANSTDDWAAPPFSLTLTYRAGTLIEFFTPQSYRWWRLTFTKPSAGVTRQAGRFLLGPYYELPKRPTRRDLRWGLEDTSELARTPGGQLYSDDRARLKTLRLRLERLSHEAADEIEQLYDAMGRGRPWLLSLDHDLYPTEWLFYGAFRRPFTRDYVRWNAGAPTWNVGLDLVEAK